MTKTIIIKDSICLLFDNIRKRLVFQADYDLNAFSIDLKNAIFESGVIIRNQKKAEIRKELEQTLDKQICHILDNLLYCNTKQIEIIEGETND